MITHINIFQSFRSSPGGLSFSNGNIIGGLDSLRQVEAKYPALLFKQQLTAYVEKIYGMIRDNLKKEITPLLGLCIQVGKCLSDPLYFIFLGVVNGHLLLRRFINFGCIMIFTGT